MLMLSAFIIDLPDNLGASTSEAMVLIYNEFSPLFNVMFGVLAIGILIAILVAVIHPNAHK